jgi:protein SDA1
VWNEDKTVNVIASGCFNKNSKVVRQACEFLIETTQGTGYLDESDDDEEQPLSFREVKSSKKTKAKAARKERELKKLQRRQARKLRTQIMKSFFPIDVIYNPQDFADRLFNEMRKKTFKFEVTLNMMSVVARMIGRHKLMVLNFYSFMKEYLNPHQKELPKILSYLAEACHDMIPPEELQPILKHLVDNFVNETMHEEKMTLGLNTIRIMCSKAPLIMDEDTINYLADYKDYKERNVTAAARALINLYRDLNPELLQKKHRGRFDLLDKKEDRKVIRYGALDVSDRLDGADLLANSSEIPIEFDRILDDDDFKRIRALKKRKLEEKIENSSNRNLLDISKKKKVDGVDLENDEEDNDEDGDDGEDEDIEISDDVIEDDDGEDEEDEEDEMWDQEDVEDLDDEENENEGEEGTTVKKPKKGRKPSTMSLEEGPDEIEEEENAEEEIDLEDVSDASDDQNPHGFVDAEGLGYFKRTKTQRRAIEKELNKNKIKEKKYHGPKKKGGGSTNLEKNKHKPLMMLRPKKNREKNQLKSVRKRIKSLKDKIGHVRNGKEFKKKLKAHKLA